MPNSYFTFNGRDCRDWHCYKTLPINFPTPLRDINPIEVPGRNGELIIDNGRYTNVEIVVDCYIDADFIANYDAMRSYLMQDADYHKLTDELYPDEYRLASVRKVEAKIMTPDKGTIEITMSCKPQRFFKAGDIAQTYTGAATAETEYSINDFSSYAKGLIESELTYLYTAAEISVLKFVIWDISSWKTTPNMMTLKGGVNDEMFWGFICNDDPLTASALTSGVLLRRDWLMDGWMNNIVLVKGFNYELYMNGELVKRDPSFDYGGIVNPTLFSSKPILRFKMKKTDVDGYIGGVNDCGVYLNTYEYYPKYADVITIDAETMNAYSLPEDNEIVTLMNLNEYITFTKPQIELKPGANEILTNGETNGLDVIPKWYKI